MKRRSFISLIGQEGLLLVKTYLQSILYLVGYLVLAGMSIYGWGLLMGEPVSLHTTLDILLYAPFVLIIGYLLIWGLKKLWRKSR